MVYDEKARVKKVESFFGGVYNENESASKKFFIFLKMQIGKVATLICFIFLVKNWKVLSFSIFILLMDSR